MILWTTSSPEIHDDGVINRPGGTPFTRGMFLGAVLTVFLCIVLNFVIPSCLMDPGRKASIEAVEKLLKLAGKRQFDEMEKSGVASKSAVKWMRERDEKWGKVVSYSFENAIVQFGGTPAEVTMRVWRERKNVRGTYSCHYGKVSMGFVSWPQAEE